MAGGGKLNRRQERALAALLTCKTVKAAARKAKVAYRTLRGWLAQPDFAAAYRDARSAFLEDALVLLQRTSRDAARALARNLKAEKPGDQVRAAVATLEQVVKVNQAVQLEDRVKRLEQEAEAQRRRQRS
jgi:hypothetical protein